MTFEYHPSSILAYLREQRHGIMRGIGPGRHGAPGLRLHHDWSPAGGGAAASPAQTETDSAGSIEPAFHRSGKKPPRRFKPSLPSLCFFVASLTIIVGMAMGIYMGVAKNHLLAPVHTHLNVVGWASLFLIGLFYRLHDGSAGRAAEIQVTLFVAGYLMMTAGLAGLLLTEGMGFLFAAIAGSLLLFVSMLLFSVIVWRSMRTVTAET